MFEFLICIPEKMSCEQCTLEEMPNREHCLSFMLTVM